MRQFKKDMISSAGVLLLFVGMCCDPDRSSIPVMISMMVIGGILCLIGSHMEGEGYDYENYEDGDYDSDSDCCDIPDRRACR